MVTIDSMVTKNHRYRKYIELFNFKKIEYSLKKIRIVCRKSRLWNDIPLQVSTSAIHGRFK